MKTRRFKIILLVLAAMTSVPAWAKPNVEIRVRAEKQVVVNQKGTKVKKTVVAKDIAPGEIITYTISYRNTGDQEATNVVINDPVPEGTAYIPGSATEVGNLTFSIDGGKTYNKPSLLTYEIKLPNGTLEKRAATHEQYTHIRWEIDKVPAGSSGKVKFNVKVK